MCVQEEKRWNTRQRTEMVIGNTRVVLQAAKAVHISVNAQKAKLMKK